MKKKNENRNLIPFTVEDAMAALYWKMGEVVTRLGLPVKITSWDNRTDFDDGDKDDLIITGVIGGLELFFTTEGKFKSTFDDEDSNDDHEWDLFIKINDI